MKLSETCRVRDPEAETEKVNSDLFTQKKKKKQSI